MTATADDSIGVKSLHFRSSFFGLNRIVTSAPYETPFTLPPQIPQITFTVTALDFAGNQSTCVSIVNLTPPPLPLVAIAAPAAGTRLVAGSAIRVAVNATSPIGIGAVDLILNGTTWATVSTAPYVFPLIVPAGLTSPLRMQAVGRDSFGYPGTSAEVRFDIDADPLTTVQGRVADASGAPVDGARVVADLHGISVEVFNYTTPLSALPDLTGRVPDLVTTVASLNLRNPGLVMGTDPLALGTGPTRVVRFTANLELASQGSYMFLLGVNQGGRVTVAGVPILTVTGTTAQFRTGVSQFVTLAGTVPIEVLTFDNGSLDAQLTMWNQTDRQFLAIESSALTPALPTLHTASGPDGSLAIAGVPTTLGHIGASATVTPPGGAPWRWNRPVTSWLSRVPVARCCAWIRRPARRP